MPVVATMKIEVRPASEFDDVALVVGPRRPDANVCWCLSYRLLSSAENRSLVGAARGERVKQLTKRFSSLVSWHMKEKRSWDGLPYIRERRQVFSAARRSLR